MSFWTFWSFSPEAHLPACVVQSFHTFPEELDAIFWDRSTAMLSGRFSLQPPEYDTVLVCAPKHKLAYTVKDLHFTSGGLPYSFSRLKHATQILSFSPSSLMFTVLRALQKIKSLVKKQRDWYSKHRNYSMWQTEHFYAFFKVNILCYNQYKFNIIF